MSFSSEIKEELSKINNYKNLDIISAEFLGYMLSANTDINSNEGFVEYITENEFNIERIYKTFPNNIIPKMHYSSPKSKKEKRSHNNYINSNEFTNFLNKLYMFFFI